jgi:hypothetical protein
MPPSTARRSRLRRSLLTIARAAAAGLAMTGPCAGYVIVAARDPEGVKH